VLPSTVNKFLHWCHPTNNISQCIWILHDLTPTTGSMVFEREQQHMQSVGQLRHLQFHPLLGGESGVSVPFLMYIGTLAVLVISIWGGSLQA